MKKQVIVLGAAVATCLISLSAIARAENAGTPTTSLGVQIALPPAYESTVASLGALATGGAAALKTYRSDARTLAIRIALSRKLLGAGPSVTSITLDKTNADSTIGEVTVLCAPRQNYISSSIALNYLNTLVQNINAISAKSATATDIGGTLKLLFATSSYAVTDKVDVNSQSISAVGASALSSCTADLKAYAKDYYGVEMPVPAHPASAPTAGEEASAAPGVDTFAFLGPIGTLIDTFLSILQPVLIDASQIVDEVRRRTAIEAALADPGTHTKIQTTGKQLATAIDNYAAVSRHALAGAFVEHLVSIREMQIDLAGVADCKDLAVTSRLPSGAPNAAFIGCWSAAWTKLQGPVDTLKTIGDSYDTLADAGNVNAQKLFGTIMADYDLIKNGATDARNLTVFANDIGELIAFANAVANAASKSNIPALKSAATAVSK